MLLNCKFKFYSLLLFLSFFFSFPSFGETHKVQVLEKKETEFYFSLKARKFSQGEMVLVVFKPKTSLGVSDVKIYFDEREIFLFEKNGELKGFFGIDPEDFVGEHTIRLKSSKLFSDNFQKLYSVPISKTDFQVTKKQSLRLNKKYVSAQLSQETLNFIEDCKTKKKKAFANRIENTLTDGFVAPVDVVSYTSLFYARRDYNRTKGKPHGGLDYRGPAGTNIYAIESGYVEVAEPMYYEGNFTIINHGNFIYSFYMHQSAFTVKPGEFVKKGQKIGEIGSTGMSTGPHLHLGVKVGNVLVDPASAIHLKYY